MGAWSWFRFMGSKIKRLAILLKSIDHHCCLYIRLTLLPRKLKLKKTIDLGQLVFEPMNA
jgi:hypothetical protein